MFKHTFMLFNILIRLSTNSLYVPSPIQDHITLGSARPLRLPWLTRRHISGRNQSVLVAVSAAIAAGSHHSRLCAHLHYDGRSDGQRTGYIHVHAVWHWIIGCALAFCVLLTYVIRATQFSIAPNAGQYAGDESGGQRFLHAGQGAVYDLQQFHVRTSSGRVR